MERVLKYQRVRLHEDNQHYIVFEENGSELHITVEPDSDQTLEQVVQYWLDDTNIKLVEIEPSKKS